MTSGFDGFQTAIEKARILDAKDRQRVRTLEAEERKNERMLEAEERERVRILEAEERKVERARTDEFMTQIAKSLQYLVPEKKSAEEVKKNDNVDSN
jgi:hypothetical protein